MVRADNGCVAALPLTFVCYQLFFLRAELVKTLSLSSSIHFSVTFEYSFLAHSLLWSSCSFISLFFRISAFDHGQSHLARVRTVDYHYCKRL